MSILIFFLREGHTQGLLSVFYYCCLGTVFTPKHTVVDTMVLSHWWSPAEKYISIQFATKQISEKWMLFFFYLLSLLNWQYMPYRETKWSLDIIKSHLKTEQIYISELCWWWRAGSPETGKRLYGWVKGFDLTEEGAGGPGRWFPLVCSTWTARLQIMEDF